MTIDRFINEIKSEIIIKIGVAKKSLSGRVVCLSLTGCLK